MPYTHRKEGNKQCVYKKNGGAKVGCTTGNINDYLAALHMHADESVTEEEKLVGGKADNLSLEDIAKKHNVSIEKIKGQLKKGLNIEMEHTNDKEKAKEIVMDHLTELPDYYDRLDKIENKDITDDNSITITESTKDLIKRLIRENLKRKT